MFLFFLTESLPIVKTAVKAGSFFTLQDEGKH